MNPETCTNVHAGRTSRKTSPCARAASRQPRMSVSMIRVRTTLAIVPPASATALLIISRQRTVCP
jgi:hypothetical protein